jgi:hypothetical protein
MAGEGDAVRALTLLVAVCEQAVVALEGVDPPADGRLLEAAERLRELAGAELGSGRLRPDG